MKNRFPSRYSNGKLVSAAQYITELICENKAKINKEDLHYKFWTTTKWSQYYRNQIASANKLIKTYDPLAIITALKDNRASKIYSLRAPHLEAIIEQYQKQIESTNQDFTLSIDRAKNKTYKKNKNTKNIISKIKDIDNGC
jgi:ribosomal protein S25